MDASRREFLKGAAFAAGTAVVSGCVDGRALNLGGMPMHGFRAAPIPRIRIGFVGLGQRGLPAVERIAGMDGIEVAAICDKMDDRLARARDALAKRGVRGVREFGGEEGWKALCDADGIDVVYNVTPWELHAPIGLAALRSGKHSLIEVPSAMTVDDAWELIETAEKTRLHCMMLENCIYSETALFVLALCRAGRLGELHYGECGYVHDRRGKIFSEAFPDYWRMKWNVAHCGDLYPTHGLGPICQCMGINCGDRLETLVSMDTHQYGYEQFGRAMFPGTWKADQKFACGDTTFTLLRTAAGRVITIKHDTTSPRPYTLIQRLQGSRGMLEGQIGASSWPFRIALASDEVSGAHGWMSEEKIAALREKYVHPYWKRLGKLALKYVSGEGHSIPDALMDLRWIEALHNGEPMDTDVYDLATWSSVCELSERSVRGGSLSVAMPDFTRGAWRTVAPSGMISLGT